MEDVQARLNCVPYNRETVDAASTDISQAGLKDTDSRIIKMMDQVNTELSYYKFILVKIDPDAKTATFKLNNPMLTEKERVGGGRAPGPVHCEKDRPRFCAFGGSEGGFAGRRGPFPHGADNEPDIGVRGGACPPGVRKV